MSETQPLDGIKVVDLTQVMLGPCATQMLGDHGADVIKIEKPGSGDLSRWSIETDLEKGDNPVFCSLNRNKRSLALDLRNERGQKVVHDLVRNADVIVNNFRPGVMARLHLGYEQLRELNPRIIYAMGTGFGSSGPYQHKGGQDVLAQAMTGVMARRADESLPLAVYATALCDYTAGMHLVQGVLMALLARERTGKGQEVEVSLYDSMLAMQVQEAAMQLIEGKELNWAAMPLSGVFETTDGAIVLVGAFKENPLRSICEALEIEDLSIQYPDLPTQREHKATLQRVMGENFASNTTAYWLERLEAQDLLCSPVKSLADALEDPQTHHNAMVVETPYGNGEPIRLVSSPVHMSDAPFEVTRTPPRLGEHGAEILAEIGYDDATIGELQEAGVVA